MAKRWIGVLVALALACMATGALAQVYIGEEKPADWNERELMRLIVFKMHCNDGMLLQVGGQNMLIDGGVRQQYPALSEALNAMGVTHLDYMFNSHPHDDHLGAQYRLVLHDLVETDVFVSPFAPEYRNELHRKMVLLLQEKGIPYRQMQEGEEIQMGKANLRMLRYLEGMDPNMLSAMLRVDFGECSILLTADVSGEGLHWIAAHYTEEELDCDIMKAAHHGITTWRASSSTR